jgi:hypothetical protein
MSRLTSKRIKFKRISTSGQNRETERRFVRLCLRARSPGDWLTQKGRPQAPRSIPRALASLI